MGYAIICPDCRGKTPWVKGTPFPSFCPKCGVRMGSDRDDDDIVMPFVSRATNRSVDNVYKAMEKASQVRAEQAAKMLGVPVSDMKAMEMTNMKDNARYGENSAVPVHNDVTRFMQQAPNLNSQGLAFSQTVSNGYAPNMGSRMQSVLREKHAQNVNELTPGKGWDAVGDRPANEVLQPGYRRRG